MRVAPTLSAFGQGVLIWGYALAAGFAITAPLARGGGADTAADAAVARDSPL